MLKISVGSVYDVSVTSLWDPEELYVLPTNQRLPSFNDPITAWTSFLPAYTDRIVLARCLQDDSWKRGRILKTEILSPCKLTLELLSPVHTPHTLHTYLHLPTSLTSLVQGTWIVVLWEGTWERAWLLNTSLDTVKVRLLDRGWNVEVEVEYSQCRDLPGQATLLPPRFVQVSLVGVEKLEDWRWTLGAYEVYAAYKVWREEEGGEGDQKGRRQWQWKWSKGV